jgi:diguanylate cyclase (GGDEF)-like protein
MGGNTYPGRDAAAGSRAIAPGLIDGTFLRSKVARRIFGQFLLLTLAPALLITMLAFYWVDGLLVEQKRNELSGLSKSIGMATYQRLSTADDVVRLLGAEVEAGARARSLLSQRALGKVDALAIVGADGRAQPLFGVLDGIGRPLSEAERRHLASGHALLRQVDAAGAPRFVLVREFSAREQQRYIAAEINGGFLWEEFTELPYRTDLCVVQHPDRMLTCSVTAPKALLAAVTRNPAADMRGVLQWRDGDAEHLAGFYRLPLKPAFLAPEWTVLASQPRAEAVAPYEAFLRIFAPAVVVAVLLVVALTLTQVRRNLVPLERLLDGTRRVSARQFDGRIPVEHGDEFGELAEAFNTMSSRLGSQFRALTALSEMDRALLGGAGIDAVVGMMLRRLPDIIDVDAAGVAIMDPSGQPLARGYLRESGTDMPVSQTRIVLSAGEIEELRRERDLLRLRSADGSRNYLAGMHSLGMSAFVVLPVVWKDRLAGMLMLARRTTAEVAAADLVHVREFRDRLGVALSTAARDEQLYTQTHYDALTGLPNRFHFRDHLTQQLVAASRTQARLAVLWIDIDRFKDVNDSAGHSIGDALLVKLSDRLRRRAHDNCFIARLGGDEFAIAVQIPAGSDGAQACVEDLQRVLAEPFAIEGDERFLSASVGIAVYPNDGDSTDALLKNAETAMYRAKSDGRNTIVYFEERMNVEARGRAELERDMRRGIARLEFELYYQPQLDLRSGAVSGAEALIRWNHPQRGLLAPGHFIDVAEAVGLIEPLGRWILMHACEQCAELRARGVPLNRVSVNISAKQLKQPDFLSYVERVLRDSGLPAQCLELEITETLLMTWEHDVDEKFAALRDLGVRLAMDDFGTGYSSLAYLRQFPFDVVKIDRSFIRDIEDNAESRAIAAAAIALARALRKEVVAEGVETEGQLTILAELGCELIQGYYFARPMPFVRLNEFVAACSKSAGAKKHDAAAAALAVAARNRSAA